MEPDERPAPSPGGGPAGPDAGFRQLAGHSFLYSFGSITGKVVGLLLVPVLTRSLTTDDFGRLDVLSTLATTITSVAVLGLDVAATRLYADAGTTDRRTLFASWTALTIGIGAVLAAVLVVGAPSLSQALFGSTGETVAIACVGGYVLGSLAQVEGLTALRNLRRPVAYATVASAAFVVYGVTTVALVTVRPTIAAALAGMASGVLVGGVASLVVTRRLVFGRPAMGATRRLFALGLPLVPGLITIWVGDFVNRAILLAASDAEQVAYLSIAIRLGSVGVLVVTAFQLAWQPHAFALAHDGAARARLAGESRNIVVAVSLVAALVAVVSPELVTLLGGSAYLPALPAIGWALALPIAAAIYLVATMPSARTAHLRDLGVSATVGGLTAIAVNVLLAGPLGAVGTAAALTVGQVVAVAVAVLLGRRRETIPVPWTSVVLVGGAGAAVALVSTIPSGGAPLWSRAALAIGFLTVLLVEGALAELVRFGRGLMPGQRTPRDDAGSR